MAQVYLPERSEAQVRPPRGPIQTRRQNDATPTQGQRPGFADAIVIIALIGAVALLVTAASRWTAEQNPAIHISLQPIYLPLYAGLSLLRMMLAYLLSLAFTLIYGHIAATNRTARRFMVPILDILQSIPILSFLPGVVLALVAIFPHSNIGIEMAAVILIFTSQAWNMTFSYYHSARTLPVELREAAMVYRLSPWRRFIRLEIPFAMIGLVWNSMMSWAGGWFFLMAAEQLQLGNRSFQLPGLGSYLQIAANAGNGGALLLGLFTLVVLIVLLDVVFWRPLVAWSDKFKFESVRSTEAPESPILDLLRRSTIIEWFSLHAAQPGSEWINRQIDRIFHNQSASMPSDESTPAPITYKTVIGWGIGGIIAVLAMIGCLLALHALAQISLLTWGTLGVDGFFTLMRTVLAMTIAVLWTVPVGVKIGMSPTWSRRLQPIVQVVASIPATAFFPVLLIVLFKLPTGVGINIAAIALMLLGTQWYVLFNVIAGAMSIPSDLREAADIYRVSGWRRWRTLILPAIFPYLVTGLITASGGAWNASIVAEVVQYNDKTIATPGLGSAIAQAAANNTPSILLASTLVMAFIVVFINRMVWRRLYQIAERRYTLG